MSSRCVSGCFAGSQLASNSICRPSPGDVPNVYAAGGSRACQRGGGGGEGGGEEPAGEDSPVLDAFAYVGGVRVRVLKIASIAPLRGLQCSSVTGGWSGWELLGLVLVGGGR